MSENSKPKRRGLMEYKFMLLSVLAVMIWLMFKTISNARGIGDAPLRSLAIRTHAFYGYWLFGVTFSFILMIEGKKLWFGGVRRDWLFFTHLPFAVMFFFLLAAIVFRFNGLRVPYHPMLGYISLGLFIPTVLTGIPMILRMS